MIKNNIKTFKFALFMVPMLLLGCGGGETPANTDNNNGTVDKDCMWSNWSRM